MFKNQLKYYRNIHKLSQEELAEKIGISRQAYSNYEQGIREPNLDILRRLCIIFDCTADELLEIETVAERKKIQINNSFNGSKNINVKL